MSTVARVHNQPSQWQITVAAEGIAAAQFARCGFDVSIQSGRDKPSYDLVVAKAGQLLRVLVNGSQDGSWDLTHAYLRRTAGLTANKANCQWAINQWLNHRGSHVVCCLVQFQGTSMEDLPRIYLASPHEIAHRLRETAERLCESTLYEKYEWAPDGEGAPTIKWLPSSWVFSGQRIQELLEMGKTAAPKPTSLQKAKSSVEDWPAAEDSILNSEEEFVRTA